MAMAEKLDNLALRDRVYERAAAALQAGRFAPGEAVTIRGLAELFGTSPMPVREAVGRLITEGALEALPNRTMRVPRISEQALSELTMVRMTLEGHAAAQAAQRMTPQTFAEVRNANEAYGRSVEAGNVAQALQDNRDFHFAIYAAAGSSLLLSMIEMLWLRGGPFIAAELRGMATGDGLIARSGMVHHFEMLAALTARDPAAAEKALRADLSVAAEWYRTTFFGESSADVTAH
jgi:DNA-binding GntR family transcriptional regulator